MQTGNTVIQLAVKDPQKTTIDPTDYNDVVNFAAIKFEYANKDTNIVDADFKTVKQIYFSHMNTKIIFY